MFATLGLALAVAGNLPAAAQDEDFLLEELEPAVKTPAQKSPKTEWQSSATAGSEAASLPFSLKITTETMDLPPYMWKKPGTIMDFPLSSVMIGDELWVIYANGMDPKVFRWKGTNIEDARKEPDGTIFVSPGSTLKGPLPREDARPPVAKGQFPPEVRRPYIFGGMWYDSAEGKLYAPSHCEIYDYDGFTRAVHLISSADKGLTWQYVGPIVTRYDAGGTMKDMRQQAGQSRDGGPGDMHLTVDERSGYFYIYGYVWTYPKRDSTDQELPKRQCKMWVARCALADKMAPGKWQKFYNGGWAEPGVGGESITRARLQCHVQCLSEEIHLPEHGLQHLGVQRPDQAGLEPPVQTGRGLVEGEVLWGDG
jgi:hypothetical protein